MGARSTGGRLVGIDSEFGSRGWGSWECLVVEVGWILYLFVGRVLYQTLIKYRSYCTHNVSHKCNDRFASVFFFFFFLRIPSFKIGHLALYAKP